MAPCNAIEPSSSVLRQRRQHHDHDYVANGSSDDDTASCGSSDNSVEKSSPPSPSSHQQKTTNKELQQQESPSPKNLATVQYSNKVPFYPPSTKYWRIGGEWYDFKDFNHPGGREVLEITRDRFEDATFAFEAHHHNYHKARQIIQKYKVKDQNKANKEALSRPIRNGPGNDSLTHHDSQLDANLSPALFDDDSFYSVLRVKVAKYLKDVGCPGGAPTWGSIIFFWSIVTTWTIGMIYTYQTGSYISACATGFIATWMATYGHNWVHQPKYKDWGWAILSMDTVGLDSEVWYRDHVLQHHMFTNTPWDHHLTALKPLIVQDQTIERNWFETYIGPYTLHLLFAIGTYSAYLKKGHNAWKGEEIVTVRTMFAKSLFPLMHLVFYQKLGGHGLVLMALMTAITGNYFYTIAFMNHNAEHCVNVEERNNSKDWGEAQMRSCADFATHLNFYQAMIYILLNFHTVHHLFPKVDFSHHPAISEIMQETAKEFNIPYRCGNAWDLYLEMYECYRSPHSLGVEALVYAGSGLL